MKNQPTLEELDVIIARIRARLAARNELLGRWFTETLAAMEAKIVVRLDDPNDVAQARASALIFVKAALHQWAIRPPREMPAKPQRSDVRWRSDSV
ncbi:hypothetical protein ACC728_25020 [Rhizobium ruizarguesonis]|uniref:hypothetical protein n=1 Tax=Rhizobium ruizarguesonis TaxID=2081791 RepID=UPI001444EB03|nr:hypothetical protein [Rhizobium ruizarguesonis]NKQ86203.1 hypothetical protein [Rhizobium ruizarguesonis]